MQLDQQIQGPSTGGLSERSSSPDDRMVRKEADLMLMGPIIEDLVRKLLQGGLVLKDLEVMVIRTVHQIIGPMVEDLVRRVMKEEFQSAQEKLMSSGKRSQDEIISRERISQLKFLDEVSESVLTGKAIEGKSGTPMKMALIDKITGKVVESGPEASAKVEIFVLEAGNDNNEKDLTTEDFNNRIIQEGDKKKPHIAKSKYVDLKAGIGDLRDVKLGQDSRWTKTCCCRLGARIVGSFGGIKVEEALTKPFVVSDGRSKLYEKHYPPSLSDEVWRLDNIGRDGAPCKRLNEADIRTVKDFLFLLSVDPQRLQTIVRAGAKMWKATVEHARKCRIDDKQICLYNSPSTEIKMNVAFDVVGQLKGIIRDSRYVPVEHLSEVDKATAQKGLHFAFGKQTEIITYTDEASLLQQFPCEFNEIISAPRFSTAAGFPVYDLAASGRVNDYIPQEPVHNQGQSSPMPDPASGDGPHSPLREVFDNWREGDDSLWEEFGGSTSRTSILHSTSPEVLGIESPFQLPSNASSLHLIAAAAVLWLCRVRNRCMKRKRAIVGDDNVQKQRRFSEEECP